MIYSIPKIVSGVESVIFSHSYIDPVFNDPQVVEQVSKINGHRNYLLKGDRSHYVLSIHLALYDNPASSLDTILGFRGVYVDEFYPYKDGDPIKNVSGGIEAFSVTYVQPVYMYTKGKITITMILVRLDSQSYVKSIEPVYRYWQDEYGGFIVDEDGNKIIT